MPTLGVVSFLNARPLIAGLQRDADLHLVFDVPARLEPLLAAGEVDAALVPLIDILRQPNEYSILSDACIASDGETMTVRVFAQVPPDRIAALHADCDSHTSVVLARLLWRELYGVDIEVLPFDARAAGEAPPAVLLIGDKVIDPRRAGYAYEIDLGGAWRQATGLPFVFAVWATRRENAAVLSELGRRLSVARDAGVAQAAEIARTAGPQLGWPVELAQRYLTRCLRFTLEQRTRAGAERFAELCRAASFAPDAARLDWAALANGEPRGLKSAAL